MIALLFLPAYTASEVIILFHVSAKPCARAELRGAGLWGRVTFYCCHKETLVVAEVQGLSRESRFYGFHIHTGESCAGAGFPETLGHYNPASLPHPHHAGDLPPLLSHRGKAFLAVITDRFTPEEILGKTVVIHAMPDDLHTQPAGAAGEKIACGVICRCL